MKKPFVSAVILSIICSAAFVSPSFSEEKAKGTHDSCKSHVGSCQKTCETALARLKKKKDSDQKVVKALSDCIQACKDERTHKLSLKDCAEQCNACAKVCEESKDPSLKKCIEECKSCGSCCASDK